MKVMKKDMDSIDLNENILLNRNDWRRIINVINPA